MKHYRLTALRGILTALAAVLLVFTGSVSSASAATTYWTFTNGSQLTCLTASVDTDRVFTGQCKDWLSQDWDWVGAENFGQQQLMSRTRRLCLTTDGKTDRNAVWLSSCDGRVGQLWSYAAYQDHYVLRTDIANDTLRASPASVAVYSSNFDTDHDRYHIPIETHYWWGTTHS